MNIHKTLKEKGWLYNKNEVSCIAYVKGIYNFWYFPEEKYLEIESEEHGLHHKGYIHTEEDLIKALP